MTEYMIDSAVANSPNRTTLKRICSSSSMSYPLGPPPNHMKRALVTAHAARKAYSNAASAASTLLHLVKVRKVIPPNLPFLHVLLPFLVIRLLEGFR